MMISIGSSDSPGCPSGLPVTTPMKTILIGSIVSPRTTATFIPASPEYFKYSDKHSKVFML